MAYNVRKMDRVKTDLQAGSKGAKAMGKEMREIFNDGDKNGNGNGTGGGTGGAGGAGGTRKPLFGKKEGGTKIGNLLRTIGSVVNKKEQQAEAVVETGDNTTSTGGNTTITPNGESNLAATITKGPLIEKESSDKKLYTDLPEKDRGAARQYNMDTYGSHSPTDDAKTLNISKEELARRYAASQK